MYNAIKKFIQHRTVTVNYPKKPIKSSFITGDPEFDMSKCNQCQTCVKVCPTKAIIFEDSQLSEKVPGVNVDECIFCRLCEESCPNAAIKMTNRFELAQKDRQTLRTTPLYVKESEVEGLSYELLGQQLKENISKYFGKSLHIREVDAGSCNACDNEIQALNGPYNDIERFGIHFVASPRHADMLLVTGPIARNMEEALIKTYNATPSPKLVVAVGACACSGGIFKDSYATRNGIDTIIPVDVYIPGCPPRPQAIIYGILKAIGRK